MSAVHFLIHTRRCFFPLVNLSLDEFLLRSPRPGAYYSPHLQYHKVSTPQFELDELKNNKPYLISSQIYPLGSMYAPFFARPFKPHTIDSSHGSASKVRSEESQFYRKSYSIHISTRGAGRRSTLCNQRTRAF